MQVIKKNKMFKSRQQRQSLSPHTATRNTKHNRNDSEGSFKDHPVNISNNLMNIKYSPLLATQNPHMQNPRQVRLPSAYANQESKFPMVHEYQGGTMKSQQVYNDKLSSTQGASTTNTTGSSNFMGLSNMGSTKKNQRKVIMKLAKSPHKQMTAMNIDPSQKPQEFILSLMKKDRRLEEAKQQNKWVLQSTEKKIVMKQSPEKRQPQLDYGDEDLDEEDVTDVKINFKVIEDIKRGMISDEDDSYEQLDVDDMVDIEESNEKRAFSYKQASPEKKSSSSYSNEEANTSGYSPHKVVAAMLQKKERKIPNSVLKPHAEEVIIIVSSTYSQIPALRVYFPYPKYCQKQDSAASFLVADNRLVESRHQKIMSLSQQDMKRSNMTLGFKMTETTHIYNSVVNTLKTAGIRIVAPNSSKWNVMWTGVTKPEWLKDMCKYQRVNHFPQSFHLGRKDLMWKNIYRMKKQHPVEYDICPQTYLLPEDYKKLAFDRENEPKSLFIMKPNASSCGKGISVLGPTDPLPKKGGYLISKYVHNPHLIDGLKYDLRIYVLVTSFEPLKVYLFQEGLTRFATEKYSTNLTSLKKRFVHLTNYSVNKKNVEGYVRNQDKGQQSEEERSSKWNLLQLKKQFDKMGIDYNQVKGRIKDVIIKTLISVEPHIVNSMSRSTKYRNLCFEVYGFDILLDSKLKPWLLEVNISPSLSSSSPLDKKIKTMLICDTMNMVGVAAYDRKKFQKEQEVLIRKRLLGLDKSPRSCKEGEGNSNIAKIVKALGPMANDDDISIVSDFEEEQLRRGNFDLIYPLPQNVNYYSQFFENNRYANDIVWKYLRTQQK